MNLDWMDTIAILGIVAYFGYQYGVNTPSREREKKFRADYNQAIREGREPPDPRDPKYKR